MVGSIYLGKFVRPFVEGYLDGRAKGNIDDKESSMGESVLACVHRALVEETVRLATTVFEMSVPWGNSIFAALACEDPKAVVAELRELGKEGALIGPPQRVAEIKDAADALETRWSSL